MRASSCYFKHQPRALRTVPSWKSAHIALVGWAFDKSHSVSTSSGKTSITWCDRVEHHCIVAAAGQPCSFARTLAPTLVHLHLHTMKQFRSAAMASMALLCLLSSTFIESAEALPTRASHSLMARRERLAKRHTPSASLQKRASFGVQSNAGASPPRTWMGKKIDSPASVVVNAEPVSADVGSAYTDYASDSTLVKRAEPLAEVSAASASSAMPTPTLAFGNFSITNVSSLPTLTVTEILVPTMVSTQVPVGDKNVTEESIAYVPQAQNATSSEKIASGVFPGSNGGVKLISGTLSIASSSSAARPTVTVNVVVTATQDSAVTDSVTSTKTKEAVDATSTKLSSTGIIKVAPTSITFSSSAPATSSKPESSASETKTSASETVTTDSETKTSATEGKTSATGSKTSASASETAKSATESSKTTSSTHMTSASVTASLETSKAMSETAKTSSSASSTARPSSSVKSEPPSSSMSKTSSTDKPTSTSKPSETASSMSSASSSSMSSMPSATGSMSSSMTSASSTMSSSASSSSSVTTSALPSSSVISTSSAAPTSTTVSSSAEPTSTDSSASSAVTDAPTSTASTPSTTSSAATDCSCTSASAEPSMGLRRRGVPLRMEARAVCDCSTSAASSDAASPTPTVF
ncbi:hypothetical protein E5Q_01619 [Mixia osmundae IAM 14324]|uniref:Uncharacterized protein n=2 Tax=Mixia osmundae (strain CBS 9802 / IAM 14324 / JCM 22182 / KY 12970) TaxID=764103 RepID=G7DWK4_MIXOS|nr:hypothetical protein E5Q_01619 [Mixia osmundae IAM 14324]